MIKARNLTFFYTGGNTLFKNLSFELEKGETLAILGPNGAGKTTLLRCLMGFLKLKSGTVLIDGVDHDGGRFWRHVSYVPQARQCVFGYSVFDMVMMGRTPYIGLGRLPAQEDRDIAMATLEGLSLGALAEKSCGVLSGGELQMVLIARALAKNPKLLILDEPESNLDMKNQLAVLDLIHRLSAEKALTIILNTHFPAHALRVAGKALLLGRDRYLYDDTGKAITEENIADFFGVHARLVDVDSSRGALRSVVPTEIADSFRGNRAAPGLVG